MTNRLPAEMRVRAFPRLAVVLLAMLCLANVHVARSDGGLSDYTQAGLKDITAGVRVEWKSDRELARIGKGYEEAYKLSDQSIWCKEPSQVRVEGRRGPLTVRYVTDGSRRMMEITTLHIYHVEDVSQEPSKANNVSDLGLITPEWTHRVRAQALGAGERDGKKVELFDYEYPQDPGLKHTIAVDPATHTLVEHVVHERGTGTHTVRRKVVYSDVREINGVSIPLAATIYNGEGNVAARMRYDRVRVNTGLPDSLFRF